MPYRTDNVAIAILRREDQLVLIQQQEPDTGQPYWVLPGGLVEPGELVSEALVREVREEAGVEVTGIGPLVCLSHIERPEQAMQTVFFVFEVAAWHGVLASRDPDNEALHAELVPLAEALRRLPTGGWASIRDPLLAYLGGAAPPGTVWFYRELEGQQLLVQQIPAGAVTAPAHPALPGSATP